MSETVLVKTLFCEKESLLDALKEIGVPEDAIETCRAGKEIEYIRDGGAVRVKPTMILNHVMIGTGNDVSFVQTNEGYVMYMSGRDAWKKGLGEKIAGADLKRAYARSAIKRSLKKAYRHRLRKCEEKDGKIRIRVSVK
jgi:hypothetical protein